MTDQKLTKLERREQAREQARLAREAEKKREKRNRLLIQGGIAGVIIVVLGIVALVLTQTLKPAGPGPLNMVSGGVTFAENLEVVPTAALQEGESRTSRDVDWAEMPVDVTVYVDYMCPGCGAFEQNYGSMLENYVGSGDITLTVFPINFLDSNSLGTKYSTRAANALACLVEQQPDYAFEFHNRLLSAEVQPAQGTTGLSDEELVAQAEASGATGTAEFKQCVKEQRFSGFINGNWKAVSETGIQGLAEGAQLVNNPSVGDLQAEGDPQRLRSTPTIIINGQQWVAGRDGELEDYILKVKSQLENGQDEGEGSAQ